MTYTELVQNLQDGQTVEYRSPQKKLYTAYSFAKFYVVRCGAKRLYGGPDAGEAAAAFAVVTGALKPRHDAILALRILSAGGDIEFVSPQLGPITAVLAGIYTELEGYSLVRRRPTGGFAITRAGELALLHTELL